MIEYISGWIEGVNVATRYFTQSRPSPGWLSPESAPAWASFGAALLSAIAAIVAVKMARQTMANEHRKEALRLLIETCSLYEKVTDYLSVETPVWKSRFDRLPQTPSVLAAKQYIAGEIKTHIQGAEERRTSHYKLLENALHEKSRSIITWQETLTDAQMRFAEAGRAMSVVAQSLNSHIERLDNLTKPEP